MLSPLLVVDNSICSGFECPLTVGLCAYFVIAIIACCCCYPGACFCPQRFKKPNGQDEPASGLGQLNVFGSIGEVLEHKDFLYYNNDYLTTFTYKSVRFVNIYRGNYQHLLGKCKGL